MYALDLYVITPGHEYTKNKLREAMIDALPSYTFNEK